MPDLRSAAPSCMGGVTKLIAGISVMKLRTDLVPVALSGVRVMRHRSRLFKGYLTNRLRSELQASIAEAPITTLFTPGQTMAMLELRKSDLSLAVLAKLKHGTARATLEDSHDLMTLGYALLQADGSYRLTPHGHFKANELARALAEQLGVPMPAFTPADRRHDGYRRRGGFQRGVFSQSGNW